MGKWVSGPTGVLIGVLLHVIAGPLHASDAKPSCARVENAAVLDSQRAKFNQSLKRLGLTHEFSSCKMLVELHQDVGDESFGGICTLNGTPMRDILVCDDTMIGKFTIKAWGFAETFEEVAAFTQTNCPGGG
ncbi:hypothetical protein ACFFJT_05555 [Dyella flava]|uniref:Uncharacterized protein n=1 Tax=Dyella flava TaxID=1920170 RepID=A0ABS2K0R8_9GAMM|nr:hypothetical protein [Dyella flava]MBM7124704.1 hypothetical protein [Dyella flava]GLQ50750.1 hypothetical protein GCM10010872_21990 [Dyella flava]